MSLLVYTVTSGWELKTTERILSAGFNATCPIYSKKYRVRLRGMNLFKLRNDPLFSGYIFIEPDEAFRKEKFETTRVHLQRVRGGMISPAQMSVINSTAMELSLAQSQTTHSLVIKRGDLMQILHGAMQGEPVEVLQARKDELLIRWKDKPGWRDAWVSRAALGKAI